MAGVNSIVGQMARIGARFVWLSILCGVFANAQTNVADITGSVQDVTGGAIVHATVAAVNAATNLRFSSTTDSSGHFQIAQLPPGDYALTVGADNFEQATERRIVLHAGDHLSRNFTLTVGQHTQVVVVEGTPGDLQTESAEVKDVIANDQVVDLPVRDREFLELAMLGPGVVNPPGGTRGDSLQQTGKLVNILGQRTGHNLFLVDGVSVTDQYYNNVALSPSPDDTREFNIAKTNYDAEFGGKSGGVINVITQSGTNMFHGSAYEFLRNNHLDARNFFAGSGGAPPFHENQFGAAFGGPVAKDKTFFFLNYDGQRIRQSIADVFSVPTAAQRRGIFTTPIVNPATGEVFAGNAINAPLDPAAVALLGRVPLPNLPGTANNLRAVERQRMNTDQANARIDHRFSDRDSAFARGSVFDATEFDPFGSSVLNEALLPGFGRNLDTHSVNTAAGETHIFSPAVVNEFRAGWLRVSGGQADPNAGNPFAAKYGLGGTTTNPRDFGFPQVSLSNQFTTIGDATGFTSRIDRSFEFYDNLSVQRGSHSLKFGGYFYHLNFNPSYPNDARGLYTFSGAYTGNALADFLLGYPSQAQAGIGEGAENAHTSWAHFFAQDSWKVTQNLTLDFGLRYEYNSNLVARANQTSNIDLQAPGGPAFVVSGKASNLPPSAAAIAAVSPLPVISAASAGWNDSLLRPKDLRLSPRTGLAWTIPNSGETVFRAGFGIYTNQAAYSILQNLAENVPFYLLKTVVNGPKPLYNTENILTFNPTGALTPNGVNNGFAIEYNEVWNATLQRPLGMGTTVEASYVGSRTVHADSATTVNVPQTFGGARPYPQLNAFSTIRWDGWATFHGLTMRITRRFQRGLSFDASYTLSKSMDDGSDAGPTNAEYNLPQNPYDARGLEKGLSSFDHRNRFVANAVYSLPFGQTATGVRHWLIAGWRTSGILTIQSGAPFTVNLSSAAGQDVAHVGLVGGNNPERPNVVANPNTGPRTPAEWFNTTAFVLPAQNTFGNAGRNIVTGPGLADLDVSLQKEEPLHDRAKIQFRLDVYNSLNHANFNLPGRIFGAANFGVITSAGDAREMQAAIRLMF